MRTRPADPFTRSGTPKVLSGGDLHRARLRAAANDLDNFIMRHANDRFMQDVNSVVARAREALEQKIASYQRAGA